MKAFLMYKDQDFDRQQLLIKREKKFHPENKPNLEQILPWNEKALIQDLGLDILFNSMADGSDFLFETTKVTILSSLKDINTILYRQHILKDCIKNESVVRDIYKLTVDTIEREKNIYGWSLLYKTPDNILHQARNKLEMFIEMLGNLKAIVNRNENNFDSEGFKRFFRMLKEELSDEYLNESVDHLNKLEFKDGILVSAELGYGNKGTNYVLRKPPEDKRNWLERLLFKNFPGYTYKLHPRDEAGARALSELRNQSINIVANALAQSMEHILNFFHAFKTELAFYVGCLNLYQKLKQINEPICFPEPLEFGKRCLSFSELYDVNLALSIGKKVVGNNLKVNGKDIFIITGANNGGKSTFLRSVGAAQLMMQAGMFVPAEYFSAEISVNIFTHFKREEDMTMKRGKLDEELYRMSEIVDKVNSKSMILLNESFASTNEKEGSEIARQITTALIESGIKVFFVTHQYTFAYSFHEKEINNAVFLRAERLPDGTRTFKLKEGEPMQTSYGEDLFNQIFK